MHTSRSELFGGGVTLGSTGDADAPSTFTNRGPDTSFASLVSSLTHEYGARWNQTEERTPSFKERFTIRDQLTKEREMESVLAKIPDVEGGMEALSEQARADLWSPMRTVLFRSLVGSDNGTISSFFDRCKAAGEEFASKARQFDPSLSGRDIRQALRNLWVFNSLQFYLGRSVCLTPSSFAYSLLYPYTDNWLDTPERTAMEKRSLNCWLTSRLKGHHPGTRDNIQVTLDRLLSMIEREYPRSVFPDVGNSLLAIHEAQVRSLYLQNCSESDDENALLDLTVEKGGTSVLADGVLVSGELDAYRRKAVFGFGVALQLIDDLQDLSEDCMQAHSTPFVRTLRTGSLESISNRLFNFVRDAVGGMEEGPVQRNREFLSLVVQSCNILVMEAVARYRQLYSPGYLSALEQYSPMRLSYLATVRQRVKTHSA